MTFSLQPDQTAPPSQPSNDDQVTADPVSSSALTIAPPTETFTIGRFSPEYVIDVSRLRQVRRHWGKALPSTFPRDRFPTPGSWRGRWDPSVHSIESLHTPNLGNLGNHVGNRLTYPQWGIEDVP